MYEIVGISKLFLIHCKLAKVQIHTLFLKTKYEVKDI